MNEEWRYEIQQLIGLCEKVKAVRLERAPGNGFQGPLALGRRRPLPSPSNQLEIQPDIRRRGALGQAADRDVVHARGGDGGDCVEANAA